MTPRVRGMVAGMLLVAWTGAGALSPPSARCLHGAPCPAEPEIVALNLAAAPAAQLRVAITPPSDSAVAPETASDAGASRDQPLAIAVLTLLGLAVIAGIGRGYT